MKPGINPYDPLRKVLFPLFLSEECYSRFWQERRV